MGRAGGGLAARGSEIAAVIVEPVAGNMNLIKPTAEFLHALRKFVHRAWHGADFRRGDDRFPRRSVRGFRPVRDHPDLTTPGKVIGGGMPVGAFGGRRHHGKIAPLGSVYQAGTLSGSPVAVAAGLASLRAHPRGPASTKP